jgi:preprotein translocase subunit YajC
MNLYLIAIITIVFIISFAIFINKIAMKRYKRLMEYRYSIKEENKINYATWFKPSRFEVATIKEIGEEYIRIEIVTTLDSLYPPEKLEKL